MKNITKLSLLALVFSPSLVFAATISAVKLIPSQPSSSFIKSQSGQENNYTLKENENGASYCKATFPDAKLCIPFDNESSSSLTVSMPKYGIDKDAFKSNEKGALVRPKTSWFIKMEVKKNGKSIFNGRVKNKVGVKCTDSGCKPWK
ncbi:hypothetical protein D5018_13060 [Parashewanella curva]|uniref:Uncharacterized protein n=1 Tax=Parashewanella curva TaxID=2338552 RepID=A0A3L8PXB3_9GAMM|nr:hypothetical protein [Parashewanella curva]RLV59273.1 hypothetical protein D5018_13060 [Parashewanella curva]